MKDERIVEEMAKLDGLDILGKKAYRHNTAGCCRWCGAIPDYLHDHNAVQRVINQQNLGTRKSIFVELLHRYDFAIITATCPQLCEAILRVAGRWEIEE